MSSIKILVVEDEKLVAADLRETLEFLGYEVPCLVDSGEEALDQVSKTQPDLVLMDIRLAGEIDGIEASKIIQAQHRIPVIYLTANTDRATLDRAKASQPFGYILKPFNERSLVTTIEIALARHQAEASIYTALTAAQTAQQATENLLQQKSDYLHLIAHELRNPLTAIKFATEILNNTELDITQERQQRYIQRIYTATKSLNELLEDVLLLERSVSQELEFFPAPIDLTGFCEELIEAFQLTTDNTHHLVLTTAGQPKILDLDTKLLWHLVSNLVSNAIKYSAQNSTVTLYLNWQDDRVYLAVSDQGIGIPPETQAKLFEPFQRGTNVGAIPGTGLGLAIAKRCAELQGGDISVQSETNQGTTFTVVFPFDALS
ncbi:MAG: ATP-binding protein [Leptolyngbyaceae cyanobacterium bins.302]|nr:ATP-binding protein [Leptolyngbyaceae cyanobacterium bins.302]